MIRDRRPDHTAADDDDLSFFHLFGFKTGSF